MSAEDHTQMRVRSSSHVRTSRIEVTAVTTSTVTITRTVTDDSDLVFVDAVCDEEDGLSLTEALGMIELGKATLLGQAGE